MTSEVLVLRLTCYFSYECCRGGNLQVPVAVAVPLLSISLKCLLFGI